MKKPIKAFPRSHFMHHIDLQLLSHAQHSERHTYTAAAGTERVATFRASFGISRYNLDVPTPRPIFYPYVCIRWPRKLGIDERTLVIILA